MPSQIKYDAERVLGGTDLTTKVTRLLYALRSKNIVSLADLKEVWAEDTTYLRD